MYFRSNLVVMIKILKLVPFILICCLLFSCSSANKERDAKVTSSLKAYLKQHAVYGKIVNTDSIKIISVDSISLRKELQVYKAYTDSGINNFTIKARAYYSYAVSMLKLINTSDNNEEIEKYKTRLTEDTTNYIVAINKTKCLQTKADSLAKEIGTADSNHFTSFLVNYILYSHSISIAGPIELKSVLSRDFKTKDIILDDIEY